MKLMAMIAAHRRLVPFTRSAVRRARPVHALTASETCTAVNNMISTLTTADDSSVTGGENLSCDAPPSACE